MYQANGTDIRHLEHIITLYRYVNDDIVDVDFDNHEHRMSWQQMLEKLSTYKVPTDILTKHPKIKNACNIDKDGKVESVNDKSFAEQLTQAQMIIDASSKKLQVKHGILL